jgi:hypothetical protein
MSTAAGPAVLRQRAVYDVVIDLVEYRLKKAESLEE